MSKKVFLSALGIVSALGSSKEETFVNLISGSTKNVVWRDNFLPDKKVKLASVTTNLPEIPNQFKFYKTRCNQLLLAAYLQIKSEIDVAIKKYGKDRIAVVIGSGTSGIDEGQRAIDQYLKSGEYPLDFDYSFLEMGTPAKFLAEFLQLEGIYYAVSTACSSGAKAFVSARNLIDMDLCDAVLVGGSDSLCKLTVAGFSALESFSDSGCNPFSANRNGITLGEGAALF
jgi:3-oxoacyl-[acyl-carrier-protein] synthase-1